MDSNTAQLTTHVLSFSTRLPYYGVALIIYGFFVDVVLLGC